MDEIVAGALIGLAGGVIGAGIGGGSSLLVARGARKQQREDRDVLLWTEKRRVAYLRFLSEAADVERRIESYTRTADRPGYGPFPYEERAALMTVFDEMRLIAPKDVVEPARDYVYNLCWPLQNAYAYLALAEAARPFDPERLDAVGKLLDQTEEVMRQCEHKTRVAMRENLGTGPEFDLAKLGPRGDEASDANARITSTGYPSPPSE
ncbi:hypothetical protein [Promicromonospora sp. NPDC050249]|uniref:hypothetical protein n=1 Tax=Promicromonospora sp. NPDC050249 TaxID=3154743 RepID=UPI0033CD6948